MNVTTRRTYGTPQGEKPAVLLVPKHVITLANRDPGVEASVRAARAAHRLDPSGEGKSQM
jgi:hypothetical protein